MEGTPRDVWHWLTSEAWLKLQIILNAPLDTPLSYWGHVITAGAVWLCVAAAPLGVFLQAYYEWESGHATREQERLKREADSKDEYELAYWGFGWRKKRTRD